MLISLVIMKLLSLFSSFCVLFVIMSYTLALLLKPGRFKLQNKFYFLFIVQDSRY